MEKIGFIGYGSMGRMLVKGLIKFGGISQNSIVVTRKNKDKLQEIKKDWPEINLATEVTEVACLSKYIFLCMKPADFYEVLTVMGPLIRPEQHVISITSAVMIEDIEKILDCKITKILPTIISEVGEGITLICHNHQVSQEEAWALEELISRFSTVHMLPEVLFGYVSQFTSSGPGFYAAMLQEFIEAGFRFSGVIPEDVMIPLVAQTMYGTAKLMLESPMSFKDVIERVAVKKGITEDGVNIMKKHLPQVFDEVFETTMIKRKMVDENLHKQFQKN